jgi:alkylhydroperoxidase family enzyme
MARVANADVERADRYIQTVLAAQAKKWGKPLLNHLVYARRPSIFKGVRAMWTGLDASALIDPSLLALVNRRVAYLNGCDFWQDINAAVSSELGVSKSKITALNDYATSELYNEVERTTLEFADAMTITGRDVSDELFARLQSHYNQDELVELTSAIAWENASSKFNRAMRVPSQRLWKISEQWEMSHWINGSLDQWSNTGCKWARWAW